MMNSLFSMFDPSNFYNQTSWMLIFTTLTVPMLKPVSKYYNIMNKMNTIFSKEIFNLTNKNISNNLMLPLFTAMLIMNLISLLPFSFATTSHISFIMPTIVTMWMSNILYYSIFMTKKMMAHMVPMGSPNILMPMLVLIELISNLIRPITLSVRMLANITAGHLLIHLLSNFSSHMLISPAMPITLILSMILMLMEMMVALIQSYIMCTLMSLYSNEM